MNATDARRITLKLGGDTFVAIDHGNPTDPLMLCVHGFPDHARSFDAVAPPLVARGFRVVAPWMRGYSPSTIDGPFNMPTIARDIVAMADALSPNKPVVLIGHDWGAVAAYFALARAPDRFRHAVTLAVPHPLALVRNLRHHPEQLRLSWYMAFFQMRGVSDLVVKRDKMAFIDRLWRDWSPGYVPSVDYTRDLKRCLGASLPAPLGYYRALVPLSPTAAATQRAALLTTRAIRVPCLYLHGAQDGCMKFEMSSEQERFFTGGFASHCLNDVGHFLHLEAPDLVADHISTFVGD